MPSNVVSRVDLQPLAGAATGATTLGERLDLVGHVKVKLAVSLGGAEISVAKLFSLSSNEVIALDRSVDAPVDVKLNDKVIARGTLVAVGDNFGVRITEILKE
jgi:flagellar motor switch protein FliN